MKIDFSKIQIKDIEGNTMLVSSPEGKAVPFDLSKELGRVMFKEALDIPDWDLGMDIYHKKEVDIDKEKAEIVKKYINKYFFAYVKVIVLPLMDNIISGKFETKEEVKPNKK
jgi:hypothetical protein